MPRSMVQRRLIDEPTIRFAISAGVQFSLSAVIVAAQFTGLRGVALALLATVALAARLPARHAAALGMLGWATATGFAVNQLGALTFSTADLERLALFIAAAVTAAKIRRHVGARHNRGDATVSSLSGR